MWIGDDDGLVEGKNEFNGWSLLPLHACMLASSRASIQILTSAFIRAARVTSDSKYNFTANLGSIIAKASASVSV